MHIDSHTHTHTHTHIHTHTHRCAQAGSPIHTHRWCFWLSCPTVQDMVGLSPSYCSRCAWLFPTPKTSLFDTLFCWTWLLLYTKICTPTHTCILIHVHTHIYTCTRMHLHGHVYIYIYIYIGREFPMYIHKRILVCTYACINNCMMFVESKKNVILKPSQPLQHRHTISFTPHTSYSPPRRYLSAITRCLTHRYVCVSICECVSRYIYSCDWI